MYEQDTSLDDPEGGHAKRQAGKLGRVAFRVHHKCCKNQSAGYNRQRTL